MSYGNARSGINNVGEYQTSGLPWVTSSGVTTTPFRVDFPYVTNFVSINVTSGSVRVGFTLNGVNANPATNANYFLLGASNSPMVFPVRCKTIFLRADAGVATASLMAGLTTIEQKSFPVLTSSATYNSASVDFVFGYGQATDPGGGTGLG